MGEIKNTTKRIALPKVMNILSPDRKKNEFCEGRIQLKRACGTEKNLQKTNNTKMNNFATKTNESKRKSLAKNKASTQIHIQQ